MNLCADQLLLALADPAQIIGLGPLARDPALSFFAEKAAAFPVVRNSAETLMMARPDILLLGRHDNPYLSTAIRGRGVVLERIDHWGGFAETISGLREVSAAIGRAAAGQALIGSVEESLVRLREMRPRAAGATFLILHKRGYVETRGVLREAFETAGLRMAATAGLAQAGGLVGVEAILAAKPDLLVAAHATERPADLSDALLEHPALNRTYPRSRRIAIPQAYALCPGPATPALLDLVRRELDARLPPGGFPGP